MKSTYLSIIFAGVLLNTVAQLALKFGTRAIGHFDLKLANVWPVSWQVMTNPYIFGGLCCYGLSVVFWIIALSRVDVSFAYPMTSLGYVVAALAGFFLFQENLSLIRIAGIIVILVGVFLVSRS